MQTTSPSTTPPQTNRSNRILWKAAITGALIMALMIPTIFISELVSERKQRQLEVAREVSSKWAEAQTLSGPFIYLPYLVTQQVKNQPDYTEEKYLILLPETLDVQGTVEHEIRKRSIFSVPLYRTQLKTTGTYLINLPKDIDLSAVKWNDAMICYGLTDVKGIEKQLTILLNDTAIDLSSGLPVSGFIKNGLSAEIPRELISSGGEIRFSIDLSLKGSEKIHFLPLAGNSRFALQSDWPSPSFDGNKLPETRELSGQGFSSAWAFNKANLPFGTVLKDPGFDVMSMAFGVTMIETADGYAKTERCIKYAILFIGLTFTLFFILELFQRNPLHPVQYILVGMALVIFYSLLLSITEYLQFDIAYAIASIATILLISIYAYSHFKKPGTGLLFAAMLSLLYGFTYVLVQLEDTALLVGSIGLFIILAVIMYVSRKINWYGQEP